MLDRELEFQSTLPRRERQYLLSCKDFICFISIHAPAKGATKHNFYGVRLFRFQSTLPRRERRCKPCAYIWSKTISIHAPAKGATAQETGISVDTLISIHAPAKGATIQYFFRLGIKEISIHAPAKGATSLVCFQSLHLSNFNPRSREGSDGIVFSSVQA